MLLKFKTIQETPKKELGGELILSDNRTYPNTTASKAVSTVRMLHRHTSQSPVVYIEKWIVTKLALQINEKRTDFSINGTKTI